MNPHKMVSFGEQLRRHRRDRGLTQEQLGEQAGLSARGIRALELGERSMPHRDTVQLLAAALELSSEARVAFEQSAPGASAAVQHVRAEPVAGFLGATPAGPIVARQEEVRHLVVMLDDVAQGTGRLVMLSGEPGVGKTRLAQQVALAARAREFVVASGRCYEPEGSVPYYPWLEALTGVYSGASPGVRAAVPERWPSLERLLPDRPQLELGRRWEVQMRSNGCFGR
jgi:transcriptional regulator with XRE-family HTH domain